MKRTVWVILGTLVLVSLLLVACGSGPAPSPTPTKPAPTQTPTATAKPTVSPAASPTAKPTASPAATAAPVSFAGKTITMVVATTAGGGTDITARVWARFLPNYLPGKPQIIVKNVPGGGGTIAGNAFYESKPDGLTLFVLSGTPTIAYMTGQSAVKYDLKKMDAVLANATGNIFFTRPNVVPNVDDILKAKGIIFGMAPGSTGYLFTVAAELMNIPTEKVILAYGGSADARRAFLAGEINTCGETSAAYWTSTDPMVKKGEVRNLFQSGIHDDKGNVVRDPNLPDDMLTAKELYQKLYGKEPTGIVWDAYNALVATVGTYSKVVLLPPNTPSDVLNAYWGAAANMVKDPEFRKTIDPLVGEKAPWFTGKAADTLFKEKMTMDPKVVAWIKDTFGKKYGVSF